MLSPISTDLRDDFAAKTVPPSPDSNSWSACAWPRSTSAVVEPAAPTGATGLRPKNEDPQPQVVLALGLRMMNCAPSMSSPVVDLRAHQVIESSSDRRAA